MELLIEYFIRILPSFTLMLVIIALIPKGEKILRITLIVLTFILLRDAMTPLGLWSFNIDSTLYLRFINNGPILIVLGLTTFILSLCVIRFNSDLQGYLIYFRQSKIGSIIVGIIGAITIALPFYFMYLEIPLSERGGVINSELILPLLIFALLGNFLEEILFRGYIQEYLKTKTSSARSIILSALLFASGHVFLATTVTNIGYPILLFTLYEGFICALVQEKYGLIASTISHGGAIFLLASGLF